MWYLFSKNKKDTFWQGNKISIKLGKKIWKYNCTNINGSIKLFLKKCIEKCGKNYYNIERNGGNILIIILSIV